VKTGFDITVEGKPKDVRTVIASPPFIFDTETERAITRFRYAPVFRPGNSVGCSGYTQSVRLQVLG
jgi:outer membrane biosynthesis protein TonB